MSAHQVPTHLDEQNGIRNFSFRTIILLIAAQRVIFDLVLPRVPDYGPSLGDLLRARYEHLGIPEHSLPLAPVAIIALVLVPFVVLIIGGHVPPPPEHGLMVFLRWLRRRDLQSRDVVSDLIGNPVVEGNRVISDFGFHAVWQIPPKNLRLADQAEVEVCEEQWGQFLSGLSGPLQSLVLVHPVDSGDLVARFERGANPNARRLAQWMRGHLAVRPLLDRQYYLAICAETEEQFATSVGEVQEGLPTLKLHNDFVRRLDGDELGQVVRRSWSPRPYRGEAGPAGPWTIHSRQVQSDLEWHEVVALGRWPRKIRDNGLAALVDGPYAVDVVQHIVPVGADDVLDGLERKLDGMSASAQAARRRAAIKDLEGFVEALAGGDEEAHDVATYLHVHNTDRKIVQRDAQRIESRVKRTGARVKNLRWEQSAALLACSPLAVHQLERRAKRVDTSSIRNAVPYVASAMFPDGSVPLGESLESNRVVGWTCWAKPAIPAPSLLVAADSGGGKGFFVKTALSRLLFAGETEELFGLDQAEEDDERGEYGLWADYCGLEYRHIRRQSDIAPAVLDLPSPGVVWNIASLAEADRPEAFVEIKRALWKRAAAKRVRRQFVTDELWSYVRSAAAIGADPAMVAQCHTALVEIARKGRHVWLGGVWMTQRVLDSINEPVVEVLQSQASSQLYGMQKPADITKIQPLLHWTPAEATAVRHFHAGQFLLVAGPWRVTMHVTASDAEFDMANTDGKVERNDAHPYSEPAVGNGPPDPGTDHDSRNGRVPDLAVPAREPVSAG